MNNKVKQMVGIALLSAVVVVLQLLGSFIHFGPVSISLVLIPIVIGAATYGPVAGAVLGGVFSVVVLLQPDTVFFHNITVPGTILTVMVKGTIAGYLSGISFKALAGKNQWLAVIVSAVVCPVVNTAIFFLGCRLFFWDAMAQLGNGNAFVYVVTVMIGFNFLAELAVNMICSPVILRILRATSKV